MSTIYSEPITDYSEIALRQRGVNLLKRHGIRNENLSQEMKSGCYTSIFDCLRQMSHEKAKPLVSEFYIGFPNGEDLGDYMNRIIWLPWFRPARKYEAKEIRPHVKRIERAFKIDNYPLDLTVDEGVARDANLGAADCAAWGAVWGAVWGANWDAALGAAGGATRGAAGNAAGGATYIIAQDVAELRKAYPENPFEKLIGVYEFGLWPAGIKDEKFVVWHPEVRRR